MIKKIAIIGIGNMGGAIAQALERTVGKKNLFLCDRHQDPNKAMKFADVVIVAVKPQSFDELATSISVPLKNKLILSIMAGVTIKKIQAKLKAKKVIRSIPNLPIQQKTGMTSWTASKSVSRAEKKVAEIIFKSFGKSIELKNESLMDAACALTGCGPAYFFYLCELISEKAKKLGFPEADAKIMAEQTFIGSAKLLEANKKSAGEWRAAVTSKKGTTEAALKCLKAKRWDRTLRDAIEAAKKRAKELNQ